MSMVEVILNIPPSADHIQLNFRELSYPTYIFMYIGLFIATILQKQC